MDQEKLVEVFHKDNMRDFKKLKVGECPSCHLKGHVAALPKATDPAHMSVMNITEESDLILLRQELEAAPPRKVSTGLVEIRQETEEERTKRISSALDSHPQQLRASIQGELEKTPLLTREFGVFRDETPEEKVYRIDKEMSERRAATPEEIEALCQQYECK